MTHVTGTGTFFCRLHATQRCRLCASWLSKTWSTMKHPPRFIGINVAPGDFAQASSQKRFRVDKDGSWLGRTARTRGANDGKREVGGFVLSPQPKKGAFAWMGDGHLNRSRLPKKMFLSC